MSAPSVTLQTRPCLQAMLLHGAKEQDGATLALQGMPGCDTRSEQLLAAIGLPPGVLLTAEQLKVLRRALRRPGAVM